MPSTKKQRGRKKKEGKKKADDFHASMGSQVTASSEAMLSPEAKKLSDELFQKSYHPSKTTPMMNRLLELAGHDLSVEDPFGDGDQSGIGVQQPKQDGTTRRQNMAQTAKDESKRQIMRTIFAQGGDMHSFFEHQCLSRFAMVCFVGNVKEVEKMIKETPPFSQERMKLLERRETGMRFPPLLLTLCASKNLQASMGSAGMQHVEVIKTLLRYGARPDAKDVTGKTFTHYAAGAFATDQTMHMHDYCVEAMKSSEYFGETVVLRNLSRDDFNGLEGVLGGYLCDKGRREVKLNNNKGTFAFQPKNIFFRSSDGAEECIYNPKRKLVDIKDRLGTTSIMEVFLSSEKRLDVARYLTEKHSVAVDQIDRSGVSVLSLALNTPFAPMLGGLPKIYEIIRTHHMKLSKESKKQGQSNNQSNEIGRSIRLTRPVTSDLHTLAMNLNGQRYSDGSYRKPDTVDVEELFWLKVQNGPTMAMPLMAYDKTRDCLFQIHPGTSGFNELYQQICAEKGAAGRKTHVMASFDADGNCTVFPDTAELKSW